jgi:hypothetical protein
MTDKERLIQEEEERFAEDCRRHKERIAEIQKEKETGWNDKVPIVKYENTYSGIKFFSNICVRPKKENTAKKYAARISLYLRMEKWADENNGEFSGGTWSLFVCNNNVHLCTYSENRVRPMDTPFSSTEIAEKAIEKFGDEILKVWGKNNE